jgi:hypothetical protein
MTAYFDPFYTGVYGMNEQTNLDQLAYSSEQDLHYSRFDSLGYFPTA